MPIYKVEVVSEQFKGVEKVRIQREYGYLLQRLLGKFEAEKKNPTPQPVAREKGERLEFSRLTVVLQKIAEGEEEKSPAKEATLVALAKQIEEGTYQVDPQTLAEAMLEDE